MAVVRASMSSRWPGLSLRGVEEAPLPIGMLCVGVRAQEAEMQRHIVTLSNSER